MFGAKSLLEFPFRDVPLLCGLLCLTSPDPPVTNCMLLEVGGGAGILPGLVFYIGNRFAGNWRCWLVVLIQARPTGSCRCWWMPVRTELPRLFQCCMHRGAQLLFAQMVLIAQALGRALEAFSIVCGSFVVRIDTRSVFGVSGLWRQQCPCPELVKVTREWGRARQQDWVRSKVWAWLYPELETSGMFITAAEAVCSIALWPCF